jgi:hypothetical protein
MSTLLPVPAYANLRHYYRALPKLRVGGRLILAGCVLEGAASFGSGQDGGLRREKRWNGGQALDGGEWFKEA